MIKRRWYCVLFLLIFFVGTITIESQSQEHAVRTAGPWGFFAEFLWAINHLEWCAQNNKTPIISWGSDSSYYSAQGFNGSTNVWEYYFEPVSGAQQNPYDPCYSQLVYSGNFSAICWYFQIIQYKHLLTNDQSIKMIPAPGHENFMQTFYGNSYPYSPYPVSSSHWYDRAFRHYVKNRVIDPFIKIKPIIQDKIDEFYRINMQGKKTVGIHLRGKFLGNEVPTVPTEFILAEANKYAEQGYQFFIATDQYPLLEQAKKTLNGPVISYDCFRDSQTTSPHPQHRITPQMGEDVLVEAQLLSRCDYFIHTLSQVSTTVLYFNPDLPHTLLY